MLRLLQWLVRQEWLLRVLRPLFGAFNPFLPEHRADPHTTWRPLRSEHRLYYSRIFQAHICTRYDDVLEVLRSPHFSTDRSQVPSMRMMKRLTRGAPDFAGLLSRNLLMIDGEDHRRLRGLVSRAFTPRRVGALRGRLEETVDDVLDRAAEHGEMELVGALAHPFPVIAIAELLGVPPSDRDKFRHWAAQLVQLLDPFQGRGGAQALIDATQEIFAYFRPLLAERRRAPQDDLLSAMLAAERDGERVEEIDLLALASLLLVAGHETTSNLIGSAVHLLLRFPDERKRLQDDLSLLPSAIDECLRYESPIQLTDRAVVEDCELAGVPLRKNQIVAAVIAAANRDPERFPDPERFDVARTDNPHLAFGHGNHFCIGSQLARLEAEIALGALLRRFPDFSGDPATVTWRRSMIVRGPEALHIRLV